MADYFYSLSYLLDSAPFGDNAFIGWTSLRVGVKELADENNQ